MVKHGERNIWNSKRWPESVLFYYYDYDHYCSVMSACAFCAKLLARSVSVCSLYIAFSGFKRMQMSLCTRCMLQVNHYNIIKLGARKYTSCACFNIFVYLSSPFIIAFSVGMSLILAVSKCVRIALVLVLFLFGFGFGFGVQFLLSVSLVVFSLLVFALLYTFPFILLVIRELCAKA